MKMQNELKASRPARVVSVLARAGDTIGAGDTLVVLE
jgi:biotin carboxyl carrier protein